MSTLDSAAGGIRALSLVMGLFLILMGSNKIGWLTDSGFLTYELTQWLDLAPTVSRSYLELVALPGAPLFARLVPLAEMATGTALICGFRVRLTAAVALAMVLNFHFASGIMFTCGYLNYGYGPPVVGSLLALSIGGRALPFSLSR